MRPADQLARERIRNDLDATVFVEAGAGTGKTRELIERVLRLVATGRAELRRIAAITFTEAAAAELRDRVRLRLEEAAIDEELPPDERERCRLALLQVDAAAIETLHAFAQRILSEHPLEAGIPPLIEIQDEIRASISFDERWDAYVDELLSDASLEDALLCGFTLGLDLRQLKKAALQFHYNWDRLEACAFDDTPMPAIDVSPLLALLEQACRLRDQCTDASDRLYQHLDRIDANRVRLLAATSTLDSLRIVGEAGKLTSSYGQKPNWPGFSKDAVLDCLARAQHERDALLHDVRSAVLRSLLSALRAFILEYANERRRQGRLEFHDLLVQARDLLQRDATVRGEVRERFSHLLIDEFQDTDPLQLDIAALIAQEEAGDASLPWNEAPIEDGRLFFVGDPKQSIYRFRRADIDLYQRAQRRFAERTVHLTQNFRSLQPIIDWVNHCFGGLMGAGGDGQATYVALDSSWPAKRGVTMRLLGQPAEEAMPLIRDRESRELAALIRSAKEEDWPVTVEEAGERRTRPAKYSDIALLLPTRTPLPPIEDALEQAGIPYRVESRSLVYDTQEVRDLLAVLRAIDDPTDEVALISALRSPAFACGDDDLLRFYQADGHWDYRRDRPEALSQADPVVAAMAALRDLHQRRWWLPISGLVEAVIRERRLFELAFAHRRPRERWQRLRFVLDQARAFTEDGGRTLRQFIDWAERQAQEGTRVIETAVPDPDDDALRIMTIHAAKGLEFPIVVLAGLNSEGSGFGPECVLWREDGTPEAKLGSKDRAFETEGYAALATHEAEMEQHEKVRLLYVAATRARDHLIVSVHHKKIEGKETKSLAAQLLEQSMTAPQLWQHVAIQERLALSPAGGKRAFDDSPERRDAWLDARSQRLKELSRVPAVAATAIASRAAGGEDDPNLRKDAPAEESPPWRRGRAGTALGRAVHAVLQSIDLATVEGLEGAARAQAAAEGIADRAGEVSRMVSTALASPPVRAAVASGRYWRELYVAAPIEGQTLEGFIDLLYETPAGLVVVDYKTDVVPSEDRIEDAMARYRLQGAAYALALEEALGRPVAGCVFLFVQPREAKEHPVADLPSAMATVRQMLRAGS